MTINAAREVSDGQVLPRRRRPAERGGEPRPPPARARRGARLRVRRDRRQARAAAAVDRRRRPRRDRGRARVGARDVQLLGRRRPHRRRLPRRRADRPLRATSTRRSSATTTTRRCACRAPAARPRSPPPAREVIVLLRHSKRAFVEKLDFITSIGFGSGPGDARAARFLGAGPTVVITDLGVLRPSPDDRELELVAVHPGVEARPGPRGHRLGRCASATPLEHGPRPPRRRRAQDAARARVLASTKLATISHASGASSNTRCPTPGSRLTSAPG